MSLGPYYEYLIDVRTKDIVPGSVGTMPTAGAPPPGTWKISYTNGVLSVVELDAQIASADWARSGLTNQTGQISEEQWLAVDLTMQRAASPSPPVVPVVAAPGAAPPVRRIFGSAAYSGGGAAVALVAMLVIWFGHQLTRRTMDPASIAIEIALAVIAVLLIGYTVVGNIRSCPKCRAFFQRERGLRELKGPGSSIRSYSNTGSTNVHYGTTTYTEYLDHFRCRVCNATWTANAYKNVKNR